MLVNVVPGLLGGQAQPGSLLYRHPLYDQQWWWRELGRVSYLGGRDYHRPTLLSVGYQFPRYGEKETKDGMVIANSFLGIDTISIPSLLFRHDRELEHEFYNRKNRAFYNNFVRTVDNSLVSHATNLGPTRTGSKALADFWDGVDQKRQTSINKFVKQGQQQAEVQGVMWAVVDQKPVTKGGDGKPYAYWVSPLDILDWEVDDEGEIVWLKQFIFVTAKRRWDEKVTPRYRFRIWSRDGVVTWETDITGAGATVVSTVKNPLGVVPFVPLFSVREEDAQFADGHARLGDMCKGANHVYNLGSLLSEILYKQTFSQLLIPDTKVDAVQLGVSQFVGWDPTHSNGAEPKFIAPDPRQAEVLLSSIQSAISDMRQGLGVGRGRQEGSMQKSSGDALELESEDKRSILSDISGEAQDFEERLAEMVLLYDATGSAKSVKPVIQYPTDFNVRSLQSEIDEALTMKSIGLSPEVNLEIAQQIVRRKFSYMPPDKLTDLVNTITLDQQQKLQDAAQAAKMALAAASGRPGSVEVAAAEGDKGQAGGGSGAGGDGKKLGAAPPKSGDGAPPAKAA